MEKINLYDRKSKTIIEEKSCYAKTLHFLYKDNFFSKLLRFCLVKNAFFSNVFLFFNTLKTSRYKIKPFVKKYNIDMSEFEKDISQFNCFNDFFIRKLKKEKRKIDENDDVLIFPCDGKFLAYENIADFDTYSIKGEKFSLKKLLQDERLFAKYSNGSMLVCRLSPDDYHRFHFPCNCIAQKSILTNGYLDSVNPIALRKNLNIFSENKRMLTILDTKNFSEIVCIEIGALNVGSINQTFFPNTEYQKAEEKGYFSLGGSSIVLLFEKNSIKFDDDLVEYSKKNIQIKARFGERFAVSLVKKNTKKY